MKRILILSLFIAVISSCSSMRNTAEGEAISLTGRIEKLGVTTYQYGTHVINANGKPYVLKSSAVILDTYVDKQVTLRGVKVAGYPIEGGPELIEVSEVIMK
ncbi:hypothetical protein [Pedobacter chinensis]|nr:hypothetical protein [Pedobacter chinensis]